MWRLLDAKSIPLESGEEGKVIVGAVTITTLQMLGHRGAEHVALVAANAHVGWERDPHWMEVLIHELKEEVARMRGKGYLVGVVACGDFNGLFPAELKFLDKAHMHSAYAFSSTAMASGGPITTCHNDQYHGGRRVHFCFPLSLSSCLCLAVVP